MSEPETIAAGVARGEQLDVPKPVPRTRRRAWVAEVRRARRRGRKTRGMTPEERKRGPDTAVAP